MQTEINQPQEQPVYVVLSIADLRLMIKSIEEVDKSYNRETDETSCGVFKSHLCPYVDEDGDTQIVSYELIRSYTKAHGVKL